VKDMKNILDKINLSFLTGVAYVQAQEKIAISPPLRLPI
jgi:hypothetical protein